MRTKIEILDGMDPDLFDARCRIDFKFFCERMLNLTSMGGIHDFQLEWIRLIKSSRNTVIEAPSGSSKSEIAGVAYPLWVLFCNPKKKLEILLVSKTIAQSEKNLLVRLQGYIQDNEFLKSALVPKDARVSWTKTGIRTVNGSTVTNVPYNLNIKGYRAHLIICDEADSYEDLSIYFKHVVSRPHPGGKIVLITTPEGVSKLVGQLKDKKPASYVFHKTTVFRKKDGSYVSAEDVNDISDLVRLKDQGAYSIWPENEKYSFDYMMEEFEALGRWSWVQNYLCEIIGETEDTAFTIGNIVATYDPTLSFNYEVNQEAMYFIGADFAISEGPRADYDAYVVVELLGDHFTVKSIETHKGVQRPQKIRRLKELYEHFYSTRGTRIVADVSNMGTMVMNDLRTAGCTVIPQSFTGGARLDLIQTLSNVFQARGALTIPKDPSDEVCKDYVNELQAQLTGFRRAKTEKGNETYLSKAAHDDIAISLAMAIKEATKQITVRVKPQTR
jgi:hypothetical protein